MDDMMNQMQRFYKSQNAVKSKPCIGALVIVLHQSDQVFKRGKITEYSEIHNKYKVHLIDFGCRAISRLTDIYEVEKSFAQLAPLAIHCTFDNILLNSSTEIIKNSIDSYINGKAISADFVRPMSGRTVVCVNVNTTSLQELMIHDKLLTEIPKGSMTFEISCISQAQVFNR